MNLPIALTLWLVSRIRLRWTLTDSDMSDVLLQCLTSTVVDPWMDHRRLVLTLASQNSWHVPSEIITTWNLRKDLHDTCPELNSQQTIRHVVSLGISKIKCACVALCCEVLTQCMLVLYGNKTIAMTPKSSYRRSVSQKGTLLREDNIGRVLTRTQLLFIRRITIK